MWSRSAALCAFVLFASACDNLFGPTRGDLYVSRKAGLSFVIPTHAWKAYEEALHTHFPVFSETVQIGLAPFYLTGISRLLEAEITISSSTVAPQSTLEAWASLNSGAVALDETQTTVNGTPALRRVIRFGATGPLRMQVFVVKDTRGYIFGTHEGTRGWKLFQQLLDSVQFLPAD